MEKMEFSVALTADLAACQPHEQIYRRDAALDAGQGRSEARRAGIRDGSSGGIAAHRLDPAAAVPDERAAQDLARSWASPKASLPLGTACSASAPAWRARASRRAIRSSRVLTWRKKIGVHRRIDERRSGACETEAAQEPAAAAAKRGSSCSSVRAMEAPAPKAKPKSRIDDFVKVELRVAQVHRLPSRSRKPTSC